MIEHIIPESLGNNAYTLPKGIVCDTCNQYFSKLDNYFCHYHLTAATKLLFLNNTKKGNPPSLPLQKGEVRKKKDGKIKFNQSILNGMEKEQFSITFFANDVRIQGSMILPDAESKKISRFLAKCGIEIVFFKKGTLAFEKDFDYLREYARYGGKNHFIPFLWGRQTQYNIELYICKVESKQKGLFYFGTVFLPGIVYFIQLNRIDEDYAFKMLAENNQLNVCDKECLIKREPIKFNAHLTTQQ